MLSVGMRELHFKVECFISIVNFTIALVQYWHSCIMTSLRKKDSVGNVTYR